MAKRRKSVMFEGCVAYDSPPHHGVGGNGLYVGPMDPDGLASRAAFTIIGAGSVMVKDFNVSGMGRHGIVAVDSEDTDIEIVGTMSRSNRGDGIHVRKSRIDRRNITLAERKARKNAC